MVERIPSPGVSAPLPVRPLAPTERTGDARLDAFQRTLATMLGSQVPVSVLARLGDGSFMVRVADTPVRMALPPGTQPGAQLAMTVLAASPQPTFGLGDATLQGTLLPLSANATSLAASVAAASGPLLQYGGQPQAADLSPAARLLGQVLRSAAGAAPLATLNPSTPLVPQGAPDPAQLAQQLQQAVAKSGLFYESHLAQWAEGKRPLAELMAEPQARQAPGSAPTEPAAAQLINQQLATQESGQLAWQGQLGPNQGMRWEIGREQEDKAGPERDAESPAGRAACACALPCWARSRPASACAARACTSNCWPGRMPPACCGVNRRGCRKRWKRPAANWRRCVSRIGRTRERQGEQQRSPAPAARRRPRLCRRIECADRRRQGPRPRGRPDHRARKGGRRVRPRVEGTGVAAHGHRPRRTDSARTVPRDCGTVSMAISY
jgi:hypothetical protein